jgi:hypothetical protein
MCARTEMKTLTTMGCKKSTKYKREENRRTEANVAVCAATERESANIFFSFFYEEGIHVTSLLRALWRRRFTRALIFMVRACVCVYIYIYMCVCVYIYICVCVCVRCSMRLSLLSLRFTNGGFAQHVLVGDFPRTAHRVEVSF